MESNKQTRITKDQLIALQLHLLAIFLHAFKCATRQRLAKDLASKISHVDLQPYDCPVPQCKEMKQIMEHTEDCTNKEHCSFQGCQSTKQIVRHWRNCSGKTCPVCSKVRMVSSNVKALMFDNFKDKIKDDPPSLTTQPEHTGHGTNEADWKEAMSPEDRATVRSKLCEDLKAVDPGKFAEDLLLAQSFGIEQECYLKSTTKDKYFYSLAERLFSSQRILIHTADEATIDGFCPQCEFPLAWEYNAQIIELPCHCKFHTSCFTAHFPASECCPLCGDMR